MFKKINSEVAAITNAQKLTGHISLIASFAILLFSGICYWLLDIKTLIPIVFVSFSLINIIVYLFFLIYKNVKLIYTLTSISVFIGTYLTAALSGGIKSSFIFFIPIVIISGYSMNKRYGDIWLTISILSLFSFYFIDQAYFESINCVPQASQDLFSFLSLLLATFIVGGVYGRYLSSTIQRSIKKTLEIGKKNTEKEILLKEIHHRVKNNLQIITSLLNLQASSIEDEKVKGLFKHSQYRINSMAMIHEMLYQTKNLGQINYHEYLLKLIPNLITSIKGNKNEIDLKLNAESIYLNVDTSITLGLIINEIITNSLKYGFKDTHKGLLIVHLKKLDDLHFSLEIGDNGKGFSDKINFKNTPSLGLKLIHNLVVQLEGTIEKDQSKKGTNYMIHFQATKQIIL